jgi:hypothetical protein
LFGSAVIEFLSWKTVGDVSSTSVVGSPQLSPPSVERTTAIPSTYKVSGSVTSGEKIPRCMK